MSRFPWYLAAAGAILCWGFTGPAHSQQQNSGTPGAGATQQSGAQQQTARDAQPRQGQNAAVGAQAEGLQFGGIPQRPWFADEGVQQQLRLTPQQRQQLESLYTTRYNQFQQGLQQASDRAVLSAQQRLQQRRQLQQQFNQEFNQALDENFRNAPFRERFNQLGLQYRGLDAFTAPDMQQQLNITPAQQQRIDQLSQAWDERLQQLYQTARENPVELRDQYRALMQYRNEQLEGILNPNQLEQWRQMTGEEYAFPPSVYFPPESFDSFPQTDPQTDRP
jgi:hypothetical protein